jgi:hypothetical protein
MYSESELKTIKDKIVKEIANGKSLKSILDFGKKKPQVVEEDDKFTQDELDDWVKMPNRTTVYQWFNPNHDKFDKEFFNNYTQAREDSADLDVEKMEELVQDVRDKVVDPQQARVIADIYKWTAGRKKPKKYGDKMDLTTGGKELTQQVTIFKIPDNGRGKEESESE